MDLLLSAAARALAQGDPLGALKRVALRDDAASLALRGIAMAQLGDWARARELLRRAAREFAPGQVVARARCALAEAEVALAMRDLAWPERELIQAQRTLSVHGDRSNALHAGLLAARRSLLLGRVSEAEQQLLRCDFRAAPAVLRAVGELARADIALRRMRPRLARAALERAARVAEDAVIPALRSEVARALSALSAPVARLLASGAERAVRLEDVETLLQSRELVVDACRRSVSSGRRSLALAKRPVLFALARQLAAAWPGDVSREQLLLEAFAVRRANDSHRARLRVEIGRLRRELRGLAELHATARGFSLKPLSGRSVLLLAPLLDAADSALLALLADGEAWSTAALALALGASERSLQRALRDLLAAGRVQAVGQARARRWLANPLGGITLPLLLPLFALSR